MNTPILFLIFNRPNTTQQVFNTIRKAAPKKLFIAADGPRENKKAEADLCKETRRIVSQIDWDCEIKTLFREKNLGCGEAISSAITWFFENVEEGIILEDDCLPNASFFNFCESMLNLYRNDKQIMMIAGANHLNLTEIEEEYFFSQHFQIWGWATWKRTWKLYDKEMLKWPEYRNKQIKEVFSNKKISAYYKNIFETGFLKMVDTWDIQWNFTCIYNNGLSIVPKYNLITNIGKTGTHSIKNTSSDGSLFKETKEVLFNPNEKKFITVNHKLDEIQFNNFSPKFTIKTIYSKILMFRKRYLTKKI